MEINFVKGYVEKNCSVRCYTMFNKFVKRFNIKFIDENHKGLFEEVDQKASDEFFRFFKILEEILKNRLSMKKYTFDELNDKAKERVLEELIVGLQEMEAPIEEILNFTLEDAREFHIDAESKFNINGEWLYN